MTMNQSIAEDIEQNLPQGLSTITFRIRGTLGAEIDVEQGINVGSGDCLKQ